MRTFTSYEEVDKDLHYYVPRVELIQQTYDQLLGHDPAKGGRYIAVWAPRQAGKSWVMREVMQKFRQRDDFEVAILTMQSAKTVTRDAEILKMLIDELRIWFEKDLPDARSWHELEAVFSSDCFSKPLILILDEFDAMAEAFINKFANEFRKMYSGRVNQRDKPR